MLILCTAGLRCPALAALSCTRLPAAHTPTPNPPLPTQPTTVRMQQAALIDYSITVASMLLPTRSLLDSAAGKPSEPSNDCSDGSREAWAGLCELSGSELESSDGDEGEGPSSGGNVPARRTPGCSPHGVNPLTLQVGGGKGSCERVT